MVDQEHKALAGRFLAILKQEAATIAAYRALHDQDSLDRPARHGTFAGIPGECISEAEGVIAGLVSTVGEWALREALEGHEGLRHRFITVTMAAREDSAKATLEADLNTFQEQVEAVLDDLLDIQHRAEATRFASELESGGGPATDAVPDLRMEVLDAVTTGSTPCFIGVTGEPRSGVTHALAGLASLAGDVPGRIRRVAVPSPYSGRMMGVSLARALDPDAPDKLDAARHDTAWNHARRFAADVSVLLVDDMGNLPEDENEAFGMALRSVAGIPEDGMVVVLGGRDDVVRDVIDLPALRGDGHVLGIHDLDDEGILALAMRVAAANGCRLGEDVLGSWRHTRAIVESTDGKRGLLARMVTAAARRAGAKGRDAIVYDDFRLGVCLSSLHRPRTAEVVPEDDDAEDDDFSFEQKFDIPHPTPR